MKLVQFLKKLKDEQVTVELKNGSTIWGTLAGVTPQMNVTLVNVKLDTRRGTGASAGAVSAQHFMGASTTNLQYINVRGNMIRQIILPESLNLDSLLVDEAEVSRLRRTGQVLDDSAKKRRRDFDGHQHKRVRRAI